MSEPFLAEIRMFGGNFAPRSWAFCNGQLLSIAQNTALFSLLGTTFGGNGQTTFGLPDLRGRVPMHWGQGPGLTNRSLGEVSGSEDVTLITTQMPTHNHTVSASSAGADQTTPTANVWAVPADNTGAAIASFTSTPNTVMSPQAVGAAGGSQPHENLQPYLCVSFIIALEGIFPSRN